ncbi:MAG TPA: T9SS type A sorting domain-containing protein [Crocinitomicaceae bacterium]|nr:T9SS type A sorting domain-containing protein [Crocinitomicaceae bacterium]
MKILLTILFFIVLSLPVFSQGAFHLKHNVPYNSEIFNVVECETGYLLVGFSQQGASNVSRGYLIFLDHNGTILWEKIVPPFSSNYEQYRAVTYHKGYFYIGGNTSENGKEVCLLIKIDTQGTINYVKTFGSETVWAMDNIITEMLVNNNGILVASSGFHNNKTEGLLIQLDFEGNILWNKFFSYDSTSTNYYERFIGMKQGKDGNFILTLTSENFDIEFAYKTIIKVTPNGDEIWRKAIDSRTPSPSTSDMLSFEAVTPYKENHVLVFFTELIIPKIDFPEDIILIEYDEHGNELNYKRFYNPNMFDGPTCISANQKDDIFISNCRASEDSSRLSVIKLNTDLEIEWDKYYFKKAGSIVVEDSSWIDPGELFDVGKHTSDNGYILSGTGFYKINNELYWNSTIIKTDCNGNTVWDYQSCLSPTFEDITIFPNPSSVNFTIQRPNVQAKDNIQLNVYDLTGKLLFSAVYVGNDVINVNSSAWASGTYICRISVNNEVVKTAKLLKIEGF